MIIVAMKPSLELGDQILSEDSSNTFTPSQNTDRSYDEMNCTGDENSGDYTDQSG